MNVRRRLIYAVDSTSSSVCSCNRDNIDGHRATCARVESMYALLKEHCSCAAGCVMCRVQNVETKPHRQINGARKIKAGTLFH